ncbi:MAG: sensitivity to high expression protein she9 [Sclerophora amabilis]|nr:MAG: sensitivity to high expression protein she9 [Sclerophora amabilis]
MNLVPGIVGQQSESIFLAFGRSTGGFRRSFLGIADKPTVCWKCQLRRSTHTGSIPSRSNQIRKPYDYRFIRRRPLWPNLALPSSHFSSSTPSSEPDHRTSSNVTKNDPARPDPQDLPSHLESQRSHLTRRLSALLDTSQSNLFLASKRLNDLTGYTPIESLKNSITTQESHISTMRGQLRAAKSSYQDAISRRSTSQREVNSLLQRKHAWSSADLERFTSLYRNDHANEQAEAAAGEELAKVESEVEKAREELGKNILRRYHEEQVWSDKIRRMSTWGTWGLMGVNVLLFLVFQVGVEPWRRRRLVNGFEEKVKQAIEQEAMFRGGTVEPSNERVAAPIEGREAHILDQPEAIDPPLASNQPSTTSTQPSAPLIASDTGQRNASTISAFNTAISTYKARLFDLLSNRVISLRRIDVTIVALEGAATGAAIVGTLCFVWMKRT